MSQSKGRPTTTPYMQWFICSTILQVLLLHILLSAQITLFYNPILRLHISLTLLSFFDQANTKSNKLPWFSLSCLFSKDVIRLLSCWSEGFLPRWSRRVCWRLVQKGVFRVQCFSSSSVVLLAWHWRLVLNVSWGYWLTRIHESLGSHWLDSGCWLKNISYLSQKKRKKALMKL